MKDSCTVSLELVAKAGIDAGPFTILLGVEPTRVRRDPQQVWELTLKGPSPVNAGRVANDLARALLARLSTTGRSRETWDRLSGVEATKVRFEFNFGRLLNFSYEFDPDVVRGLGDLGASTAFYHRDHRRDETPMQPFGSGVSPDEGCEVCLRVSGDHFDPDDATSRLGIEPSSTGRTRDGSKRFWLLESTSPRARNADEPIIQLLKQLPTKSAAWTSLSHAHQVQVLVAFQVRQMTGHFDLDADTISTLAECGCGLDASFYDWGPEGADLL
jgi:hypothetical protein